MESHLMGTAAEMEDWLAYPSPDGKWLLFLSFPKGTDRAAAAGFPALARVAV
jgi:hypothetical protein